MEEYNNAIFQMRFPQKLWYLLKLRPDAILWGGTGRTILINYKILQIYLQYDHSVFKTTNISSFVRQLNLYGFRKVTSHLQDPLCNSSNPFMHEYIHDLFQFGKPELLNKITRKALTMKRNFKPKITLNNVDQLLCLTPLQKARHSLHVALKKAARDIYLRNSSTASCSKPFQNEVLQGDISDESKDELDWLHPKDDITELQNPPEPVIYKDDVTNKVNKEELHQEAQCQNYTYGETKQDALINYSNYSFQQNNESFPPCFNMPNLDAESPENNTRVKILAEFEIDNDIDIGLSNEHGPWNCVLPSVSNYHNDDMTVNGHTVTLDQYNGDWDLMFNDMINREPNHDSGSELKELYSQITKTIDLLD